MYDSSTLLFSKDRYTFFFIVQLSTNTCSHQKGKQYQNLLFNFLLHLFTHCDILIMHLFPYSINTRLPTGAYYQLYFLRISMDN